MVTQSRLERWHGIALIATAATIPLGEGIALGAAGWLAVLTALRARHVRPGWLLSRPVVWFWVGILVWVASGLAALWLGREGWLDPSEVGRWASLLLLPLIGLASTGLPRCWIGRATTGFIVSLTVASIFALATFYLNIRPGETLTREVLSYATQSRIPGVFDRTVAGGFYYHRLKMAHVLAVGLAVLIGRQLFAPQGGRRRATELAVLGLMGTTLLLTFARAAFLGVVSGLVVCMLAARRGRILVLGAAFVGALTVAFVPTVRDRVVSIASRQASEVRALLWSQGVQVIVDHPWGAGLGNYRRLMHRYYDILAPDFFVRNYAHSVVLSAWAETGPLGLTGWLWAWMSLTVVCLQRLWQPSASACRGSIEQRTAAAIGAGVMIAFWVIGLTHDVLFHPPVGLAFAGAMGLVVASLQSSDRFPSPPVIASP